MVLGEQLPQPVSSFRDKEVMSIRKRDREVRSTGTKVLVLLVYSCRFGQLVLFAGAYNTAFAALVFPLQSPWPNG